MRLVVGDELGQLERVSTSTGLRHVREAVARLWGRTSKQIQEAMLTLPKMPDRATPIGGDCAEAKKAIGEKEAIVRWRRGRSVVWSN